MERILVQRSIPDLLESNLFAPPWVAKPHDAPWRLDYRRPRFAISMLAVRTGAPHFGCLVVQAAKRAELSRRFGPEESRPAPRPRAVAAGNPERSGLRTLQGLTFALYRTIRKAALFRDRRCSSVCGVPTCRTPARLSDSAAGDHGARPGSCRG